MAALPSTSVSKWSVHYWFPGFSHTFAVKYFTKESYQRFVWMDETNYVYGYDELRYPRYVKNVAVVLVRTSDLRTMYWLQKVFCADEVVELDEDVYNYMCAVYDVV